VTNQASIRIEVLRAYQLQQQGGTQEAERLYREVLREDSSDPYACHQLGLICRDRGDLDGALGLIGTTVRCRPDWSEAHSNYGVVLNELERYDEALESFERSLTINANGVAALYNRGNALLGLNRVQEALASYERAIALQPEHADAQFNAAMARLCLGDFGSGWRQYEWRWRTPLGAAARRHVAAPLWLGDAKLAGKTILLHAEQGLGDTIQFARYAPIVARLGARVLLEVQPSLRSIFVELEGVSAVISRGEPIPRCDLHCPLLSLPLALATELTTVPGGVPYLSPADAAIAKWSDRLPQSPALRIGLAWSGNPDLKNDRNRSISLQQLAPLWSTPGVQIVSLQRDVRPGDLECLDRTPGIIRLESELVDFAETAAVIANLDLVISVDTAVAHLAGALGTPVWLLLPFAPDFRWMIDRDDSPWYPTARLFRQPRRGDWSSVIGVVRDQLLNVCCSGRTALHSIENSAAVG
jgi:Tfp pilus assembly protein PilF